MYLTAIGTVAWLIIGTVAMKALLRNQRPGVPGRLLILIAAVILATVPVIALRYGLLPYSLAAFFAAAASFFWFPILAARARWST
jgi:hypothetical protein